MAGDKKKQKNTVSIIIPTYNERGNIEKLIPQIFEACKELNANVEVVVVDDNSPDGTGQLAESLAKRYKVKVIHRTCKKGLASAAIQGFSESKSDITGVMDADLSHPPEILPRLLEPIINGEADLVIGSRYIKGGGVEVWPFHRRLMSRVATLMARPLTKVKDPLSGLFFMKRNVIEGIKLKTQGYKIGLEILVKGKYATALEVPYVFRNRFVGKSKISAIENFHYMKSLFGLYLDKMRNQKKHKYILAKG